MTDPRPSSDQTDKLLLTEMRRRGFFDDVPNGDDFFAANPEIQRLGYETADAQHVVAAIDRLTEQQRIANLIAYATHRADRSDAAGHYLYTVDSQIREGLGIS